MVEVNSSALVRYSRMAWRCPACGVAIDHLEFFPHTARTYHCTICHLALRFDPERNQMTLAPLMENTDRAATAIADMFVERRTASAEDRRQYPRGGRRASDLRQS